MEIPSSHSSRHTPLRHSAPRDLAKTIARDETNMSTFDCTRKLPQHEHALVLLLFHKTFILLKHLYIFVEKVKKNFRTFLQQFTILFISPKLLLFPTIALHGQICLQQPHTDPLV